MIPFGIEANPRLKALDQSEKLAYLLRVRFVNAPGYQTVKAWCQWKRSLAFEWLKVQSNPRPDFLRRYK